MDDLGMPLQFERGKNDSQRTDCPRISKITRVLLPRKPSDTHWDVSISAKGRISSIDPHREATGQSSQPGILEGNGRLLAPSLCHAHIHLDKCFLLQDPKYMDLQLDKGDFKEAMTVTAKAKARFDQEDLLRRGRQLIEESVSYGVTAMRAFVEVDPVVDMKCLNAGLTLKNEFRNRCDIQLCAFAQLPLFSGSDNGQEIRKLMHHAMDIPEVEVIGSTPYVEDDESKVHENAQWIIERALEKDKFLDLHLDYTMDSSKSPVTYEVIDRLKRIRWKERGGKHVTLGHCTRLTMCSQAELSHLRSVTKDLPFSFVGLPTSDLYMMKTECAARGTLNIPGLIKTHGFEGAIGVNNICNAFTPYGSCDPLTVAQLGVGLYQTATKQDVELLYECVSSRAKSGIGLSATSLDIVPDQEADFVLFPRISPYWRTRKTIAEVIYESPSQARTTIKSGRMVKRTRCWTSRMVDKFRAIIPSVET